MSAIQLSISAQKNQNEAIKPALTNFKTTNFLQYLAQKRSPVSKIRKDKSSIAAFYATPEKLSPLDIANKLSTKSLLQTNLPTINHKRRSQKRSGFVEMWLDEALDSQIGSNKKTGSKVEVEKTGPLRTVQKFQIDKKYLRSQSIDDQVIDKLYNSLYVYTYGINNTFTQIISLTKSNEHVDNKIVSNFWRAFAKLLEGCTSYQTAYQIIELNQNKALNQLRDTFVKKQEDYYNQKKQHQEQIAKLHKKVNEQSALLLNLTNDYKISQATLNLTDEAFNQEVSLRLKFQQKINSVFLSYQQIKGKYQKLLTQLKIRDGQFVQIGKIQTKMNKRMEEAMIYIQSLQKKLGRAEQTVRQRDQELDISRQQIFELTQQLNSAKQTKDYNQEEVRKVILRMNSYKQKSQQVQCQSGIKHNLIRQMQLRIQQQTTAIASRRQANQTLYEKYQICEKQVGSFKILRYELECKIQQLQREAVAMQDKNNHLLNQNSELFNQANKLQEELQLTKDDLQLKLNCIQKNSDLIDNLRAIKNKSESLYQITAEEKNKIEKKLNQALKVVDVFEEEMKGMKMLLDNKAIELSEVTIKLQTQREVFRSRLASLKEELETKDNKILTLHDKQMENQDIVNKSKSDADRIALQNKQLRDQKLQLQANILQLQTKLSNIQQEHRQHRQFLRQMTRAAQSAERSKIQVVNTLNQKQFLLSRTSNQNNNENNQLKFILQTYRRDREMKICFVHPMIYEDCREQINRLTSKAQSLQKDNGLFQIQRIKYQDLNSQKDNKIQQLQNKLDQANKTIAKNQEDKTALKKKNTQLQNQVSQALIQRSKTQKKQKEALSKQVSQREKINKIDNQNRSHQSTIRSLNQTITHMQKQNKQSQDKIQQFRNQISLQKQQITQLQQEATINRRSQSNNTKRISSHSKIIKTKTNMQQSQENQENGGLLPNAKLQSENTQKTESKAKQAVMISQQVQTDKPKFSHASKFQTGNSSYACQVNLTQQIQKKQSNNSNNPKQPRQKEPKVQDIQFKRFLKLTYMRR